jgi:hypothetical protein
MNRPLVLVVVIALTSASLVVLGDALEPSQQDAPDMPDSLVVKALTHWDAGWYAEIAKNGYWYNPGHQSPVAYFPLYPMVVRALTLTGLNRWVAGPLLSFVCAIGGMLLFRRWALRVKPEAANTAFLALLLYPFNEYLYGVMYSDALFLVVGAAAFYMVECDRPFAAAFFGALATACRPVAPALVIGLVLRSLERRRTAGLPLTWRQLVPGLAGIGFAAYLLFLGLEFNDPLAFAHVQGAPGWEQLPGWHSWLKIAWFKSMFPRVAPLVGIRLGTHAAVTIGCLVLSVVTYRVLGVGYGTYCLICIGIPAFSTKDFQGLGRYAIAAFPLFMTWATVLNKRPRLRLAWLIGSGLALIWLAIALGMGAYVS